MYRFRLVLLAVVIAASACASSTYVVTEAAQSTSAASSQVAVSSTQQNAQNPEPTVDVAAALATVAPLPTVTPTAAPQRWVVVKDPSIESKPDEPDEPRASLSDDFAVGRCYDEQGWRAGEATPCTQPHTREVAHIGTFTVDPSAPPPSDDAKTAVVHSRCVEALNAIGVSNTPELDISTAPYFANKNLWDKGDYSYVCFARFPRSMNLSLAALAAQQGSQRAAQQAAADAAADQAHAQAVAEQQINVGECARADGVTKTPCSGTHTYVAYSHNGLASANGVYPGQSLIVEQYKEFCPRGLEDLGLKGYYYFARYPSQYEWENLGYRTVVCLVRMTKSQFDNNVNG